MQDAFLNCNNFFHDGYHGLLSEVKMAGIDFASELLAVIGKTMELIPNYDQRKKDKYFKLLEKYENEKNRDLDYRDANLLCIYRDELMRYISVYHSEISKSEIHTLH